MHVSSFVCDGIKFDIHDTDRVSKGKSKNKYFVTPKLTIKIEAWMIQNNKDKIRTKEEVEFLVNNGYMGIYV